MKKGDEKVFFKKFKKTTFLILLTLISIPLNALAYSDYIIAGGQNIGIEIKSKGVMVVGTYEVGGKNIASDSGIKVRRTWFKTKTSYGIWIYRIHLP